MLVGGGVVVFSNDAFRMNHSVTMVYRGTVMGGLIELRRNINMLHANPPPSLD